MKNTSSLSAVADFGSPTATSESPQILSGKVDDLNHRLDSELKASNDRYEALLHTTERDFHAVELVVLLGSLFVGVVVGWATYREVQQRNKERAFYEGQATRAEKREEQAHSYAIRFADQQWSRSGDIMSGQIDNMTKLGGVIDLMNKTFDKQLTTLTQLDQLKAEIVKLQASWTNVEGDYEKKYATVDDIMSPFKERNRMDVSRLSREEAIEPSRALALFPEVPDWFLTEREGKDRFGLANLHYLLGQAAYYGSQVTVALDHLHKAVNLYANDYYDDNSKKLPRAFCSHYLGLIDKNWCPVGLDKSVTLDAAKRHLQDACELLKADEKELLTPVTLAEVCSYSSRSRATAVAQLGSWELGRFDEGSAKFDGGILQKIEGLSTKPGGLDTYQSELLTRALLIRGNIEYAESRYDNAKMYYDLASQHDGENPYALLSLAQASADEQTKADLFARGWEALQGSGNLGKREVSGRALALAWAVIANHTLQQKAVHKYLRDLKIVKTSLHSIAKRDPLFFCPITKGQVFFDELMVHLVELIKLEPRIAA